MTWVKKDEQIKEIDYNHIGTKDTVMIYPTPLKDITIGIHGIIADVNDDLGNYINPLDGIYFVGEIGSYVSIYEIGRTAGVKWRCLHDNRRT